MTISTGTRFGQYEIAAPLGKGGMGEVYLARDTRLERQVALKILPLDFTQSHDRLRRFEQEAKTVSALNHPNILTIHEIGAQNGTHFITTEFIAGQTLRDRLQQPLSQSEAMEIASQIAHALAAAHEANIIHRDIKPENIMLRRDGLVKVLDFGLAKLTEERRGDTATPRRGEDESTLALSPAPSHTTEAGTVMGTASYMSPEQARGEKVDARTDIFSLGVVLYEMLAGQRPFEGVNMIDVLGAILHQEPAPLANAPAALQHIVTQALRKDRNLRYASVKELQAELRALQRELEFAAEAQRRADLELSSRTTLGAEGLGAQASRLPLASVSEANRVVSEPAEEKAPPSPSERAALHALAAGGTPALPGASRFAGKRAAIAISLLALVLVAVGAYFFFNRKPVLTDKDTILLAEFDNKTGDAVFDGTLRQGLAVQLQQSPFLSLFPDERIRATLRLMNKSPDERVTREVGREIALRQGVKAVLAGTIVNLGRNYSLTLEALNSQSGEAIALVQTEAEGKEQVLKSLSQAATQMREKLGESLASIQKFDAPLEVTTSSLEALQAFSRGWEQRLKGDWLRAIPHLQRAVELDPNFASAYAGLGSMYSNTFQTGLSIEATAKAYNLKERANEYERLHIAVDYCKFVTGEVTKGIETLELMIQLYPREHRIYVSLASDFRSLGQFEKAIAASRAAMQLNPNAAAPRINLGWAEMALNRFAEAKETFAQSLAQKMDSIDLHEGLYRIAFVTGDATAMQQQLDWAIGTPAEHVAFSMQTHTATFAGQWRKAQEFSQRAFALAMKEDAKGTAATYALDRVLLAAALNQPAAVKASAQESLAIERSNWTLPRIALAFALVGVPAQSLVDELNKRYPKDTLINGLWLPTINAALELQRGNAQAAVTMLEPAKRYEPAAEFWPQYVRGLAYLKLNQAPAAAAEFQKIIDRRGESPLSVLWPLAHLGLARAAVLQSDTTKAKQMYDEFFRLWKDADADLPVLIEAKKEYEKLK